MYYPFYLNKYSSYFTDFQEVVTLLRMSYEVTLLVCRPADGVLPAMADLILHVGPR